jgi:hypothetical protein
MSAASYPPASMTHLIRRVPNERGSNIRRNWTGNDESARSHHGKVALSESPLRLRLSWKKGPKDSARLVGVFDLNLKQLLKAGYIRVEPKSKDEVRLRFYHDLNNVVIIQVNSKEQGLTIGKVP